jgi:ubiquinone/menaquinone biosynthesis C-methylase UbiE
MIKQLEDKVAEHNLDKITVTQLNINDDHDLKSEYDIIYSSMSLHHVTSLEETLQNFYDLLQDGGQLCIVDLDKEDGSFHSQESNFLGHNGFEQKELSQLLEQVGFNNIMSETFYNDERSIGNRNIEYSLFIMKAQK